MLIFGSRVRSRTTGFGEFTCPVCRTPQQCHRIVHRRWFTLYFLPLLPLGSGQEQVACQGCLSRFEPESLSGEVRPLGVMEATSVDSGTAAASIPNVSGQPPRTSGLAITSLTLGVISPLMLCLCSLSLVTSLIAIVTGHVSLWQIKNSGGNLAGRGIAIGGLLMGYPMLLVSILVLAIFLPGVREGWQARELEQSGVSRRIDAAERLRSAEADVMAADTDGWATGNSNSARDLADDFSVVLKQMREALFTSESGRGLSLTKGEFVTHCEIHEGHCAFIVHVPSYRQFDSDAKQSLASLAWQVAQMTATDTMQPGDRLAVGMRGTLFYGAVMVGEVAAKEGQPSGFRESDRDGLLAFFEPSLASTNQLAGTATPKLKRREPKVIDEREGDPLADVAPEVESSTESGATMQTIADQPPRPGESDVASTVADAPNAPLSAVGRADADRPGSTISPDPEVLSEVIDPSQSSSNVANLGPRNGVSRTADRRRTSNDRVASSELLVQQFPDMGWAVKSLDFSPDGRWLAAGKMDRKLLILDIDSGKTLSQVERLEDLSQVDQVQFSPDGKFVVAAGYSGAVVSWRVDEKGALWDRASRRRQAHAVKSLQFSPTAPFLITGDSKGELIWQSFRGETSNSRTQKALKRAVVAVYLPAQGIEAMATDGSHLVRVNLRTAKVTIGDPFRRGVAGAAAFSGDGSRLAICNGYRVELWDTRDVSVLRTFEQKGETQWCVAFLPDHRRLLSGGRGKVTLWDIESKTAVHRFDLGSSSYVQTIAVSRDGSMLAAIPSSAGQTLAVFRIPE
jgi:WD40 repeat protein